MCVLQVWAPSGGEVPCRDSGVSRKARPPLDTEEAKQLTRSTPTPFPSPALCWNAGC